MKNFIKKGIVLSCMLTVILACNSKKMDMFSDDVIDPAQIKSEIVALETEMAEMYNLRSAASEEYYAEDAISFTQNKAPLVGKLAIDKYINEELSKFKTGDKISFSANEIFPSADGEQVVEIGSYKVVNSKNDMIYKGNYMSLFVKKEGKYACIRNVVTSDMPIVLPK